MQKKDSRPQRWLHDLCDCCQDPTLACAVCLCSCNATGQMYQRATGSGCFTISVFLWAIFLTSQALTTSSNSMMNTPDSYNRSVSILGSVAGLFGLVSSIAYTYFLCTARRIVRERDRIPQGLCGRCDDCCTSYWCGCCSLVQMFRQENITGDKYRVCTEEAV